MSARTRITGALVGLIALVVLGWLFTGGDSGGSGDTGDSGVVGDAGGVSTTAGVDPSRPSGASSGAAAGTDADGRPLSAQALSALPPEAAEVWRLIGAGGPFEYDRDGATFGNREGLLPPRPNGYYREYTVPTPGEGDRGARRLVTGQGGELYYTADHYASFVRVEPDR